VTSSEEGPEQLLRAFREALAGESGEALAQAMLDDIAKRYGEAPLVARVMRSRPGVYVPTALKNSAIVRDSQLGRKTAELLAVAAAAALMCEPCLDMHVKQALKAGNSEDDVLSAILVAGSIAESSVQAYGFRSLTKVARQLAPGDSHEH
jgi:AhpD family alkylhydroperoxidase